MINLRAEHELLISIARKSLDQGVVDRVGSLVQQNLDWPFLFQTASSHGLLPLLSTHLLTSARSLLSETVLQQLRADCLEGSKSNLYLVRELLRVMELLKAEDIRALAFKGPVLGEMIYGDVGLRQAGDLDILIAKDDFSRTRELLESNRYLMQPQLTPAQQRSHLGFHCEIQFSHQDDFTVVDLHWGLSPKTFPFLMRFEELWARRQSVSLAGHAVETFSNEDLVLYLSMHGAKHYWGRLEWIAAVAELVRSSAIDWDVMARRANDRNSKKFLSLGLLLASDLFGLSLEGKEFLTETPDMREVAVALEEKLFQDQPLNPTQIEMFRWNLQFMDRRSDAVKSFLRSIFVPTISDWQARQLPDAMYPFYYGIRPFNLVGKYWGKK